MILCDTNDTGGRGKSRLRIIGTRYILTIVRRTNVPFTVLAIYTHSMGGEYYVRTSIVFAGILTVFTCGRATAEKRWRNKSRNFPFCDVYRPQQTVSMDRTYNILVLNFFFTPPALRRTASRARTHLFQNN